MFDENRHREPFRYLQCRKTKVMMYAALEIILIHIHLRRVVVLNRSLFPDKSH